MTDLGKVGINPRKAWVSEATYERLDLVSYKGAAYLALKETTVEPVDDNINWMLIAEGVDSNGVEDIVDQKIMGLTAPDIGAAPSIIIENKSFDDMTTPGIYDMQDCESGPSGWRTSGLLVLKGGPFLMQIAFAQQTEETFIRICRGSEWGEWGHIRNARDSDTVDGFHASKENTADAVVVRGGDGIIHVGDIISDAEGIETTGLSQLIGVNGSDGRYRKYSNDAVRTYVGNYYIQLSRFFNGRIRSASSNVIKYVRFLRLNTVRYAPYPMIFKIANRSNGYIKVALSFIDISSYDPGIKLFQCAKFGTTKGGVYIAKAGASTWDLYMDAGNYDMPSYSGDNLPDFGLVQCDEVVQSLPNGYIAATEVTSMP